MNLSVLDVQVDSFYDTFKRYYITSIQDNKGLTGNIVQQCRCMYRMWSRRVRVGG